jgi:hypothetical protein
VRVCVHRGEYMRVYMSACVCTVFLKKKKHGWRPTPDPRICKLIFYLLPQAVAGSARYQGRTQIELSGA